MTKKEGITSLELSKNLHAIGYRGETEKYYHKNSMGDWVLREYSDTGCGEYIPAPNATELLRDMPEDTSLRKWSDSYTADHPLLPALGALRGAGGNTPAEALGLLYLSLHEKGII